MESHTRRPVHHKHEGAHAHPYLHVLSHAYVQTRSQIVSSTISRSYIIVLRFYGRCKHSGGQSQPILVFEGNKEPARGRGGCYISLECASAPLTPFQALRRDNEIYLMNKPTDSRYDKTCQHCGKGMTFD